MAKRIADLRPEIKTLEDAEGILKQIALAKCNVEAKRAAAEKRIAAIKDVLEEQTCMDVDAIEELQNVLSTFIEQHKHLFEKPRKHKCDWGTFGLQKVCEVVIESERELLDFADKYDFGGDLLKVVRTPIKSKIETRLKSGETIGGCFLKEGDTAVYTVAKALIDEAKESA